MGVEYIGVCHDCKQFIDCHKCYAATDFLAKRKDVASPTHSNFMYWGESVGYWGMRLIWFMLWHTGHKTAILSDHDEDSHEGYFEIQGRYAELASYKEMQEQAERMKSTEKETHDG